LEPLNPGTLIAERYRLERKLGSGGMGSVWLARDLSLDSTCAIKLVDHDKLGNDEVRVRFQREARAAAQIRSANVVDVFDHGLWRGMPFIVMEYLQGEDLGARLERLRQLSLRETYDIVAQVARALVRAHALGIVHRDLKPENIFLVPGDDHEIAKVLDFGIAKLDQYSLTDKTTKTGSFMGTPYYMSPEQARGKGIDWRSDLWALGIIIYQCLTGRPPFESEALGELLGMIMYDPIPKLTEANPELPAELEEFWQRATARDREARFQTAKELADAFALAAGLDRREVPLIAPRNSLTSLSESPSVPPPADTTGPMRAFRSSSGFTAQSEVELETGSPVSRTRLSVLPQLAALTPRQRALALIAGIGGLVLIVMLVAATFVSSTKASHAGADGVDSPVEAPAAPPVPLEGQSPAPVKRRAVAEPPPISVEDLEPVHPDEKDKDEKRRRGLPPVMAPAPARSAGSPDYGI
jgi:serine/threonine-protein kinase